MKVDIDEMAECFSQVSLTILDAYKFVREPGEKRLAARTAPSSAIIFPLRGRARMAFDGAPYEMEPGKFFHAGPNMTLDKEVVGQSQWEFVLIHYQIPHSEKGTFAYALSHYELNHGHNPRINDLLQKLCHTCTMPGSLQALRAKSLFFSVMDEVLTCSGNRQRESGRELVEQAMEYINNHYMEQLTIPKLAEQYNLGSKQFAYLFKKHGNISPNDYLISQRVSRAKELLCTTACSISEISDCVGYSDPYYFSKLFKKRTGVSPSTLRIYFEKKYRVI